MPLKSLLALCLFALPASVAAQGTTALATDGGMYFAMSSSVANALYGQGISIGVSGYNYSTAGYPGFPLEGGSLDLSNGNGITQFNGSIDFQAGTSLMQLKELSYVNVGTTPFLSAAIYENGAFLYRQLIFIVISGNGFGPLAYGGVQTNNIYFSFNPMFVTEFDNFFQTPQLATALAPTASFGATGFFGVAANLVAAPPQPVPATAP